MAQSGPNIFQPIMGKTAEEAQEWCEKTYPDKRVKICKVGSRETRDYREDRIRVFVDAEGKVDRAYIG